MAVAQIRKKSEIRSPNRVVPPSCFRLSDFVLRPAWRDFGLQISKFGLLLLLRLALD